MNSSVSGRGRTMIKYLVGQRIILNDKVIGTITKPENANLPNTEKQLWVYNPEKGYASYYSVDNIKPIPNGQL